MGPRRVAALQRRMLAWFAGAARDLPWRSTRDPYAIWISEAMLQQTRVETVIPYWERFLTRFPDVAALARVADDDLLAAWSGLGYYRRARALRDAAREIVARHGGSFPTTRAEALTLPGVGPYTAGAVLSIAHGLPEPVVDGNVERVFARWFELEEPAGSARLRKELWELAERLVPATRPGDWNQAVMELGATVCTPRNPSCGACPVARLCAARAAGRVAELPRPKLRREPVDVELQVLLTVRGERVLLVRRPERGRMAGMFELPTREVGSRLLWPEAFPGGAAAPAAGPLLGEVRHGITHHRIRVRVHRGELPPGEPEGDGWVWASGERAGALALTGMTKKVLERPFAGESLARVSIH